MRLKGVNTIAFSASARSADSVGRSSLRRKSTASMVRGIVCRLTRDEKSPSQLRIQRYSGSEASGVVLIREADDMGHPANPTKLETCMLLKEGLRLPWFPVIAPNSIVQVTYDLLGNDQGKILPVIQKMSWCSADSRSKLEGWEAHMSELIQGENRVHDKVKRVYRGAYRSMRHIGRLTLQRIRDWL